MTKDTKKTDDKKKKSVKVDASKTPATNDLHTTDFLTEDGKKATLVTKEGLEKLVEELEYLKTKRRQEVADMLKSALSHGDLSENSEYSDAKTEQAFVEGRIHELEAMIENVKLISGKNDGQRTVQVGSTVQLKNLTKNEKETYSIVGSTEANPFEGKISNESPLGSALLDKAIGEKVRVDAPVGFIDYEIIGLS